MNGYKMYVLVSVWQRWTAVALYFVKSAELKPKLPKFSSLFGSVLRLPYKKFVQKLKWSSSQVYAWNIGKVPGFTPAYMHCHWSAGSPYCGERLDLLLFQFPLGLNNISFSKSWPIVPPAKSSPSPSPHPKQGVCRAHGEVYQLTLQVTHVIEVGSFWEVEWFPICSWSSSLSSKVLVLFMLSYCTSISLYLYYKLQTHHQMQNQQPHTNCLTWSHNGRKTNHCKSFIPYHSYGSISLIQQ